MTPAAAIDQRVYHSALFPSLRVRTTHSSTRSYACHFHDCISIGVVFAGETRLRCLDDEVTLGPGSLVVLPAFTPHSCNPVDGRPRGYHMFYLDACRRYDMAALRCRVLSDQAHFAAMMRLADAVRNQSAFDGWERLLERILAECNERESRLDAPPPPPALTLFRRYGMDAPDEKSIAAQLGMERETFIRSFRRAAGLPPGQYRQCLRLAHGLRLLEDGESIAQAALRSGFCDQSHFHRMCVKYLSATPSQLRPRLSQSSKTK